MIKNRAVGELVRAEIIESTLIVGQTSRFLIKLDGSYPFISDVLAHDKNIRVTDGKYFIKYSPEGSFVHKAGFHYVFGNDLVGFCLKFKNATHFEQSAKIFPEIAWLLKYSNYNPKLFYAAKVHPGMCFYFSINWGEYVQRLVDWAGENGIDPLKHKPLVSFRPSTKDCDYKLDDKAFAPTLSEYGEKVAELKRLATECEE